jgi:hypothetical protein
MAIGSNGQGIDVGDAVLTFLGDTTQLDQAFNRIADEAAAKMGAAADSVGQVGDAVDGVTKSMAVGQQGAVELGEVTTLAGTKARESMYQARGETQLLGEMFGIHLPRHVRSFVAELPGIGTALSAAFTATAVLFLLEALVQGIEKLQQWAKAAHEIQEAWDAVDKAQQKLFANLDDNLLKAEERTAELTGNSLEAMRIKLQLINNQSLGELDSELEKLGAEADKAFEKMDRNWFSKLLGLEGSEDAKDKFDEVGKAVDKALSTRTPEAFAGALKVVDTGIDEAKRKLKELEEQEKAAKANVYTGPGAGPGPSAPDPQTIQAFSKAIEQLQAYKKAIEEAQQIEQKEAGNTALAQHMKDAAAAATLADKAFRESSKEMHEAMELMKGDAIAAAKQKLDAVKAEAAAEQKIIVENLAAIRTEAQKSLTYAKEDAREQLQILVAGLKEQEAALQAKEQKGLLTKKQVLIETEALQRQETAAKIAALKQEAAAEKEALDVEEQSLKLALTQITDEKEYEKALDRVLAIEQQRSALAQKFANDEHVASMQGQKDLATTEGKVAQLEKTWATYFNQMHRDLPSIGESIRKNLQDSIDHFNKQFSADFANMLVTGKGFAQAMKSLGQDMAKSFISMLTEMLLKWVETQIAMKILGISSSKETASSEIAASAAVAGANMIASWSLAPWPIDSAAPAMGAVAYADALSYEGLVALATGGLVTGPTRAMIGEKGPEAIIPLTDPDVMARLANALLSPSTLRAASSDPRAIAAASNASQGGFDDAAIGKLGDIIGAHLDASGGAGDVHNHHWHVKGMISPDNLQKVMKQMSNRVLKNQSTLHSSNSLRITRRSQ